LSNFGKVIEYFVLHAVGKVSVIFVWANVLEGQDRNALLD
jgi:hypothetical protein